MNDTTIDVTEGENASSETPQRETHPILVQVNTDHNIHGSAKLNESIEDTVNAVLGRFGRHVTRVEIHLSDENASKSNGDDKSLPARSPSGRPSAARCDAHGRDG